MKRLISLFLCMLMGGCFVSVDCYALTMTNDEYEYTLMSNGTIEITGYYGNCVDLTIPENIDGYKVTSIGKEAFAQNTVLESVIIGGNIVSIEAFAFSGCTNLISVTISKNIETIGEKALGYDSGIWQYVYDPVTNAKILKVVYSKIEGFIIKAYLGTPASSYADENEILFKSIGCKHLYVDNTIVEASCGEDGIVNAICSYCYDSYEKTVDALGHKLSIEWIIDKKPTKTAPGSKHKECTACGIVLEKAEIPATANNFTDVFDSQVFKLWWSVAFSNRENIYEFSPKDIKWYTVDKIDLYEYYAGEKEVVDEYGSYTYTYSAIPADVFENEARKHFNITDINVLRDDTNHDPIYNAETNTYDMPFAGGWGDSITYVTKGYKTDDTGKYEVYGYTVEMAYEKPDDAVEGVDYIMLDDYPAEIVKCLKVTIEYNGTDVKFLSWETISLGEMPDIEDLIHSHVSSDWITDKKATVNAAGSKHQECTQCGAVLKTETIPQLKPATPKLSKVANTASGVQVTWGKVTGADNYTVYRKTYDAKKKAWSGWTNIAKSVTSTSYVDKTAKSGTYYLYTVKANNEAGASGYNTSGIKTYFISAPTVTTANANSGVTVKWAKITGATGYIVYRKEGSGGWKNLGKTTSTSFTDKTAKAGVTYKYTVKAYYSSYFSAYNTSGVAVRRLTTPTLKSATSAKTGVTFTWNKVTGATGYIVYRKTGSGSWQKLATVKGTSTVKYLDKSAKKGVTYTYTVKAYYGTSTSAHNTKGLAIKDKY